MLIEKLYLALYYTCTKLKNYTLFVLVYIIYVTDMVKYMLIKPTMYERINKWMLTLSEYTLQYILEKSVKG